MRVALVGAGNVGTAVAYLLSRKGHEVVAVASRSADSARSAAERLGSDVRNVEDLPEADLVLIGASESGIEAVDALIAPRLESDSFVWHLAGAFGPSILSRSLEAGAIACALHPVQAIYSVDAGVERLPGSAWGITCSDRAADASMSELVERDLDGVPVIVPEEARPLWHAASVMTSNGIAALMALSESLLSEIGVADPSAVLGPLVEGTAQNARAGGGGGATLTGPVVRGEAATVRRHMQALLDVPGEHAETYGLVCLLILRAAVDAGRIDVATFEEVMRELGP